MNHITLPLLSLPTCHPISFHLSSTTFLITNIHSSQTNIYTFLSYHTTHILSPAYFRFLSIFITYILVVSKPLSSLPLRTVSPSLFTSFINHLPYSHASLFISCINHMIIINMPMKQTHSSFSIISCPHLIASFPYSFLCLFFTMGEQYGF